MGITRRRMRRFIQLTGSLTALAAAILAIAPAAEAGTRAVGPDGNLWAVNKAGKVIRIDQSGDSTSIPVPAGIVPESIASGPGQKLSVVARPEGQPEGAPTLHRIELDGTFDPSPTALGSVMAAKNWSGRDLAIGPDGSSWASQGWEPCVNNTMGNITRVGPGGGLTLFRGPLENPFGTEIYPNGPLEVDGAGRAWFEAFHPYEEVCVDGKPSGWTGSLEHGYIDENDEVRDTNCKWSEPVAAIATDGAAWCLGVEQMYRMAVDGSIVEYDYPEGWSDPSYMRAGPDGSVWFATLTKVGEGGWYVLPWTIASISPAGELRTYPTLADDLIERYDQINDYVTLYDWYFTANQRLWLMDNWFPGEEPFAGMIDLPAGESKGILAHRSTTFPTVPDPVDPVRPPVVETPRLQISLNAPSRVSAQRVRRTRTLTARVTTSAAAKVTFLATITNRAARSLGLRARRSKTKGRMVIGSTTAATEAGRKLKVRMSRTRARKLTKRRVTVRLDVEATSGREFAGARRSLTIG